MYVYTEKDLENIRKEVLGKIADQCYELDITSLAVIPRIRFCGLVSYTCRFTERQT